MANPTINILECNSTNIRFICSDTDSDLKRIEIFSNGVSRAYWTANPLNNEKIYNWESGHIIEGLNKIKVMVVDDQNNTTNELLYIIQNLDDTSTLEELVDENNNIISTLAQKKELIASAITAKKVPTSADATFDVMATNISNIKGFSNGWDIEISGEVFANNTINTDDAVVVQKYGDWDTKLDELLEQPNITQPLNSHAYTTDGKFLIAGNRAGAFNDIYSINGDVYTRSYSIGELDGTVNSIAISKDDQWLALACSGIKNAVVCKKDENGRYKIHQKLPTGNTAYYRSCAISSDGKYVAFGSGSTYGIKVYKRNESGIYEVGNYFPSSSSPVPCIRFTPNDNYLIFGYSASSDTNIYTFKITDNDKFVAVTQTEKYVNQPNDISISPDGKIVNILHNSYHYVHVYTLGDNGKLTKLPYPTVNPSKGLYRCSFSSDSQYLALQGERVLYFYKRNPDNTFTKVADPSVALESSPSGVSFSPNNLHVCTTSQSSPSIKIYRTETKNIVTKYNSEQLNLMRLSEIRVGVAMETKNKGEQIETTVFPKLNIMP